MSEGKFKIRLDGATGNFSAEYYVERTDVTPTIVTLPTFPTAQAALDHLRKMFPDVDFHSEN